MRNLRILIIDDQGKRFDHVRHIDPVVCITEGGRSSANRLTRWPQHLRWYVEDQVPEFDLLLIDVDFSKDGSVPDSEYSKEFNPHGLLHALPLAARQHASSLPFAWVIGTGKRPDMRENSVAVVAFGLLCAMEQRVLPSVIMGRPYSHFQKEIDELRGPDDREVFVTLMKRYREQVITAAKTGRIEFDTEELRHQLRDAERGDSGSMRNLLDSGLTLYYGYHMEEINFRSLFAEFDVPDNHTSLVDVMRGYLSQLLAIAEKIDIYDEVVKVLERLRRAESTEGTDVVSVNDLVSSSHLRANTIKMGVVVCAWLEEYVRSEGKRIQVKEITAAVGLQQNQVQEVLKRGGVECPLGHYLHLLASRPLELPSLYNCAASFWKKLRKPKGLALPGCLQQPNDKVQTASIAAG